MWRTAGSATPNLPQPLPGYAEATPACKRKAEGNALLMRCRSALSARASRLRPPPAGPSRGPCTHENL